MNPQEKMIWEIKTKYGLDSPKVFSAMLQIPRDRFVAKEHKNVAYLDGPVPIGHGQTMSQPYTVAFMTDLLDLKGNEKVLEIGTGSGYQAAVLSQLAKEVYTIEIIDELTKKAQKIFKQLKLNNIHTKTETGEIGWPEKAPFDAIMITAGVKKEVPQTLFNQLGDNSILVAPIGTGKGEMMTKYKRLSDGKIKKEEHGIFYFVPFIRE